MRSPDQRRDPGHDIRLAAHARRPRCWCGCPDGGHRPANRRSVRSCRRCGAERCPTYVPGTELSSRVTAAHRAARGRSDMAARHVMDAVWRFARDAPAPSGLAARIPRQRRPGTTLQRADL